MTYRELRKKLNEVEKLSSEILDDDVTVFDVKTINFIQLTELI